MSNVTNNIYQNYGYNYNPVSPYANNANTSATQAANAENQVNNVSPANNDTSNVKAVAIEKSKTSKYKTDFEKIESIYATQKSYYQGLQSVVNQIKYQSSGVAMLNSLPQGGGAAGQTENKNNLYDLSGISKMGGTVGMTGVTGMKDYFSLFVRNNDGSFSVDLSGLSPESQEQLISKAKEDVSENGYFGVKQTSERILDFAKAITGGNPEKMEQMKKVVDKAFKQVGSVFGGLENMPDITQQTYDAIMKGFSDFSAASQAQTA